MAPDGRLAGLTLAQAAVNNQASTTVANTPGGGMLAVGVTYAMCRSWGFVLACASFAPERDVGRVRTLVEPTDAMDEDEVVLRLQLQK